MGTRRLTDADWRHPSAVRRQLVPGRLGQAECSCNGAFMGRDGVKSDLAIFSRGVLALEGPMDAYFSMSMVDVEGSCVFFHAGDRAGNIISTGMSTASTESVSNGELRDACEQEQQPSGLLDDTAFDIMNRARNVAKDIMNEFSVQNSSEHSEFLQDHTKWKQHQEDVRGLLSKVTSDMPRYNGRDSGVGAASNRLPGSTAEAATKEEEPTLDLSQLIRMLDGTPLGFSPVALSNGRAQSMSPYHATSPMPESQLQLQHQIDALHQHMAWLDISRPQYHHSPPHQHSPNPSLGMPTRNSETGQNHQTQQTQQLFSNLGNIFGRSSSDPVPPPPLGDSFPRLGPISPVAAAPLPNLGQSKPPRTPASDAPQPADGAMPESQELGFSPNSASFR
eukprot:gene15121-21178_t